MRKKSFLVLGILSLAVLVLAGCSNSQNQNQNQERNQDHESVWNGNDNINSRRGESGEMRNGNRQMGPPEEAQKACSGLSEGDSCNFTMTRPNGDEEERTGICQTMLRDNDSLICSSGDMAAPGSGGPRAPSDDVQE